MLNSSVVRELGGSNYSNALESTSMFIYCVYLTVYKGNKLPPFYIGSSSIKNVKNGYRGSVASKLYHKIWKSELRDNPALFTTRVLSTHATDKEARQQELKLHKLFNVVKSELYMNRALAKPNGFHGADVTKEKHPRWGLKLTPEERANCGSKNVGKIPHNKNVLMDDAMKARISNTKTKNPKPAWNKGKEMDYSADAKRKQLRAKTWLVIDPRGIKHIVLNLKEYCTMHQLNWRKMREAHGYNMWQCSLIE
jgi:hypothetical protein